MTTVQELDYHKLIDGFANAMKAKMDMPKNMDKKSWREVPCIKLVNYLLVEVGELTEALFDNTSNDAIISECVDIANFAMMIADRHRK